MDPPAAAADATAKAPLLSSSPSLDRLLLFDAYEEDEALFTPLAPSSNASSIPAHDALMAFLAEMEALNRDDEQQSGTSSDTNSAAELELASTTSAEAAALGDDALESKAAADEAEQTREEPEQKQAKRPQPATRNKTQAEDAKPAKKRIRAKQELDMLREDSVALQRQLEILQATATVSGNAKAADSVDSVSTAKPKKPKLRHVGAVEQNRQLRKLIKTQLRYTKQIENVLTSKSLDNEHQARQILISDNAITQTPLSKADLVVFYEALTGKLDALYAQLDSAFADVDTVLQTPEQQKQQFTDAKLVIDDHKDVTLQLRDVKMLPFSFEKVKSATWRLMKGHCVQEGDGADELLVADDDVMLMRRGMTVQLEEGEPEVEIPTRAVVKRFLSKDRIVVCWDGTTDWPPPPQDKLQTDGQGVPLREKGWAVIKPVPGAPGMSTAQMCLLMTPGFSDDSILGSVPREEIEEGINRIVVPTYQQAFASRYQMLENMLLDEHIKR